MFYQPLEVPIQGVWTIVVELKTVTPVAAVAAALAGNGGPVRRMFFSTPAMVGFGKF